MRRFLRYVRCVVLYGLAMYGLVCGVMQMKPLAQTCDFSHTSAQKIYLETFFQVGVGYVRWNNLAPLPADATFGRGELLPGGGKCDSFAKLTLKDGQEFYFLLADADISIDPAGKIIVLFKPKPAEKTLAAR